jgi:hypothetical protein
MRVFDTQCREQIRGTAAASLPSAASAGSAEAGALLRDMNVAGTRAVIVPSS